MRRARVALAAAGALALALACAPAKRPAPAPRELVFWAPWPAGALAPALAGFEAAHPGLRVRVEAMADSTRARRVAQAGHGALPDLCAIGTEDMPTLLAGGRLADWSAGIADLRPALRGWESCMVGDAIYGVPWLLAPRALFVNPALLARAGVRRMPETWADLERASAAVSRTGRRGHGIPIGPGALETGVLPLLAAGGGDLLSGDRRHAILDSAANVRALELLVRLRRSGLVASQEALEREFAAGRLGSLLGGPSLATALARSTPVPPHRVLAVPRPDPADTVARSWATGEVLVSFNLSRRRHDALDLARHLAAYTQASPLARAAGAFVPSALPPDSAAPSPPAAAAFLRQLDGCRYAPAHRAWGAMKDSLAAEVERALRGRKTAAAAVADAQTRIQEILER